MKIRKQMTTETKIHTERREIVFSSQWSIGQYCSKRRESVPLSLYISRTWRERTFVAVCSSNEERPLSLYFISIL